MQSLIEIKYLKVSVFILFSLLKKNTAVGFWNDGVAIITAQYPISILCERSYACVQAWAQIYAKVLLLKLFLYKFMKHLRVEL